MRQSAPVARSLPTAFPPRSRAPHALCTRALLPLSAQPHIRAFFFSLVLRCRRFFFRHQDIVLLVPCLRAQNLSPECSGGSERRSERAVREMRRRRAQGVYLVEAARGAAGDAHPTNGVLPLRLWQSRLTRSGERFHYPRTPRRARSTATAWRAAAARCARKPREHAGPGALQRSAQARQWGCASGVARGGGVRRRRRRRRRDGWGGVLSLPRAWPLRIAVSSKNRARIGGGAGAQVQLRR